MPPVCPLDRVKHRRHLMTRTNRSPDLFAADIGQAIDDRRRSSGNRKAVVDRKLRTVLLDSGGWKRRGENNLRQIAAALDGHGIHTDWDLSDERLTLDSYIWFSRHPIRRRDIGPTPFKKESDLIKFIAENHQALFRGIPELERLRWLGSEVEYQLTPSEKRPDIEFENPAGKRIVVEVELGDPQENSTFQLRKYMSDSKADIGVLVTARPSSADLEDLIRETFRDMEPRRPAIWLWYDFGMTRLK
jgi:hypothetical protein